MKKIIIVAGQTATGKTTNAIEIAKKQNGELINCDSRQIYKGLDIITGKDVISHNFESVATIDDFDIGFYKLPAPIWLYDIVNPQQHFSSYDYSVLALGVIADILDRGKTPILVGGTGFYLRHLLFDIAKNKVEADWNLRAELSLLSVQELQSRYKKLDGVIFESLNNSEKNNPQRLIRKIEIASNKPNKSEKESEEKIILAEKLELDHIDIEWHILLKERKELEPLITSRVEKRLEQGALSEVKSLLDKGYEATDPGMKTIGYQQLIGVVKGKCDIETAKKEWITRELQYAKRQKTYLNKLVKNI